jgi:hypothetical protein
MLFGSDNNKNTQMKKLFCFLAITSLALTSCSSSDDGGSSSGTVLLKKTIENGPDGNITSIATYNGTKLDKITATGGYVIDFTYTGNLITQVDYKLGTEVSQTEKYTYDGSNRMASYVRLELDVEWGPKEVYVYNGDGTVTVNSYSGDLDSQTNGPSVATISFLANGEVDEITSDDGTISYTYDNKNNPFMNVTGYSKVAFSDMATDGILHNVTLEHSTTDSDLTRVYTYNEDGFPTNAVESYDGDDTTTEFFYN